MDNEGYLVVPTQILNAADFGVPQTRERIFLFGFRKECMTSEALEALSKDIIPDEFSPYPKPTHGLELGFPWVSAKEALWGLEEPSLSLDAAQRTYSKAQYLGGRMQGQREIDLNTPAPTIRAEHHGNIEYRRLSQEHNGTHFDELSLGQIERRLTPRECARFQSFPDDYGFVFSESNSPTKVGVSASGAYKLIGNAVPCILGYNIAKNLEFKWDMYFKKE